LIYQQHKHIRYQQFNHKLISLLVRSPIRSQYRSERLPTAARPGRMSMVAVVGPRGRWWRRRGCRGAGCQYSLHRRGPGMGVVAMAKGSRHGSGGDDGVLAAVACALVASLVVWRWFSVRETKFCEVIQAKRQVLDL
jgi:hypothetical protein